MGITGSGIAGSGPCRRSCTKTNRPEKGFVFSIDLAVAMLVLLLFLGMTLMHLNSEKESILKETKTIELQKNALLLADSLVKNSNPEQPLLGAAVFDPQRRRVASNILSSSALGKAAAFETGGFFVLELSLEAKSGGQKYFISGSAAGGDCVSAERFVVVDGEKALLRVVACEK